VEDIGGGRGAGKRVGRVGGDGGVERDITHVKSNKQLAGLRCCFVTPLQQVPHSPPPPHPKMVWLHPGFTYILLFYNTERPTYFFFCFIFVYCFPAKHPKMKRRRDANLTLLHYSLMLRILGTLQQVQQCTYIYTTSKLINIRYVYYSFIILIVVLKEKLNFFTEREPIPEKL
jgi:hypothetical protein